MKLWTAEQTARRMTAFLMVSGLVFVVGFGFLACLNIREGRVNVTFLALAVIGLALLVQASGMVYYLRRRGRSGVRGLSGCCIASVAIGVITAFVSRDEYGSLALLVPAPPIMFAPLSYALATRRLERGDPSPLMPGAERLAKTTWKEILFVYLVAIVVMLALYAVSGEVPFAPKRWEPEPPAWGADDIAESDWSGDLGF